MRDEWRGGQSKGTKRKEKQGKKRYIKRKARDETKGKGGERICT